MSDLISREAALDAIKSYCSNCDNYSGVRCSSCMIDYAIIAVDAVPAVDAEPVRHGKWIKGGYVCGDNEWKCSVCGETEWTGSADWTKFCMYCGAKMDLEDDQP